VGVNTTFLLRNMTSSKVNRKSSNSQPKKVNGVERKNIRRPNKFKSDDWYQKAALSMAITTKR